MWRGHRPQGTDMTILKRNRLIALDGPERLTHRAVAAMWALRSGPKTAKQPHVDRLPLPSVGEASDPLDGSPRLQGVVSPSAHDGGACIVEASRSSGVRRSSTRTMRLGAITGAATSLDRRTTEQSFPICQQLTLISI